MGRGLLVRRGGGSKSQLAYAMYRQHYGKPSGTLTLNNNGVKVTNVMASAFSEGSVYSVTITLNLVNGTTRTYTSNSNVVIENVKSVSVTTNMDDKINNCVGVACIYE